MVWGEKVVLDSPDDSVVEDIGAIQPATRRTGYQVEIDLFDNVPHYTRWTTEPERAAEVAQIARDFHWFQTLTTERDVILAVDFNYPPTSPKMGPIMNLPDVVNLISAGTLTTLKASGQGFSSWYDHLYVNGQATTEATGKEGAYDFAAGLGYTDTQQARSEISDHLPVWAEFGVDQPDDD